MRNFFRITNLAMSFAVIAIGSSISMLAMAQDEPQPTPPSEPEIAPTKVPENPTEKNTEPRRIPPRPFGPTWSSPWASPTGTGDSMWGPAIERLSKKETRWYGWQQMIPLITAEAVFIASWASGDLDAVRATLVWGPAVHLLAGPIVHFAHGHFDKGVAAFGLNLFMPLTTLGLITLGLDSEIFKGSAGFALVVGLGGGSFLAAQAIDIAYLSNETVLVPRESARQTHSWRPSALAILPMIKSDMQGVVLTGQF